MARRYIAWAVALSLGLHGVALLVVVLAPSWPWPAPPPIAVVELPPLPSLRLADEAEPARAWPAEPAPSTEIELRSAGDDEHLRAAPSAPTRAPNPDERATTAAASGGGIEAGAPTRVTDRSDAVTLRTQPYDATRGYRVQRIRTSDERESREQVRATPHPALSPWLASLPGAGHARHAAELRPPPHPTPAAQPVEPLRGRELVPVVEARAESLPQTRDREGTARPWLPEDPASTDSAAVSEEVNDRSDAPLVSDVRVPDALELTRPAAPGEGHSSTGEGSLGYAPAARGTSPVPAGAPNLPRGPLRLSTYQRQYDQYVSRLKQKVDPLWEFPRDLALRLEQGDLLVSFTIARDGRLKELRLLKRSGFPKFDKNVLSAIKKAAPFDPLPATFGEELRVMAPFAGGSPAIR